MTSADARSNGGFMQTLVIIASLILLISGLILSIVGVINPSWQVVDIREFRAEHHHGLWLDCTKTQRPLSAENLPIHNDRSLHCTYKFDQQASDVIDQNIDDEDGSSAAAEAVHHQFFFWQKACLACIFISLITGGLALISGTCSPCSPPCALIFSILTFIAFLASTVAAIIFFFAAHRVDNRFVQGLVGTYEQTIGSSFYVYILGTVLLLLSTLMSIVGAYQLLNKSSDNDLNFAMQDFPPMFHNQRTRV
uniref:Clc-like protein 2 n=1 Tax=Panagrellus redivivus TaxID=6233 RepID=A0A7E4VFJ3_PANRE